MTLTEKVAAILYYAMQTERVLITDVLYEACDFGALPFDKRLGLVSLAGEVIDQLKANTDSEEIEKWEKPIDGAETWDEDAWKETSGTPLRLTVQRKWPLV